MDSPDEKQGSVTVINIYIVVIGYYCTPNDTLVLVLYNNNINILSVARVVF